MRVAVTGRERTSGRDSPGWHAKMCALGDVRSHPALPRLAAMTGYSWPHVLGTLTDRSDLDAGAASWAMNEIMSGAATGAQIAAFGIALKMKGLTITELAGIADEMLVHATRVQLDVPAVDVVGTGGDRHGTVNVSTMAAIVVAATGIPVIKHGNRAASSRSGGADLLQALGVNIELDAAGVVRSVHEAGIGFCFAPVFHPAFRFIGGPRREIGVPTVFNVLGPLTNPAQPQAGLIGCAFPELTPTMAGVLAGRGTSALVVRGRDGLDEITTTGPTDIYVTAAGEIRHEVVSPADWGIGTAVLDDLRGGAAEENAVVARAVLAGESGPVRDAVLLNAAGAIAAFSGTQSQLRPAIAGGLQKAAEAIDSGAAAATLAKWVRVSGEAPATAAG